MDRLNTAPIGEERAREVLAKALEKSGLKYDADHLRKAREGVELLVDWEDAIAAMLEFATHPAQPSAVVGEPVAVCPECGGNGYEGGVIPTNEEMRGEYDAACTSCLGRGNVPSAPPSTDAAGEVERRLVDAYAALRSIAEGNLGDAPWQANYATVKQVAHNALTTAPKAPQVDMALTAELKHASELLLTLSRITKHRTIDPSVLIAKDMLDTAERLAALATQSPSPVAAGGEASMRTLVQEMLDNLKHCSLDSGCCHCGDDMSKHADPMSCDHTPVDMGWTAANDWIAKADAALATPTAPNDDLRAAAEPILAEINRLEREYGFDRPMHQGQCLMLPLGDLIAFRAALGERKSGGGERK